MTSAKQGYWSIWWTLAVISAAIGVLAVILEFLGVIRDLGTVIGIVSMALTALFGLIASTRNSLRVVGEAVAELRTDIHELRTDIRESIQLMTRALQRIEAILEERLPRAQALRLSR